MPEVLTRVKPIESDRTPPTDAVVAGRTPDGKHQLYRLKTKRSRPIPKFEDKGDYGEARKRVLALRDEGLPLEAIVQRMERDGFKRVYRRNPLNGEALVAVNEPDIYDHEELFYLEDEGTGQVRKVHYRFPTPAEIADQERRRKVAAMQAGLAEALVDAGASPADLVAALKATKERPAPTEGVQAAPAEKDPDAGASSSTEPAEYPVHLGFGKWKLSDGTEFRGKKEDAIEAEGKVTPEQREAYLETVAAAGATEGY